MTAPDRPTHESLRAFWRLHKEMLFRIDKATWNELDALIRADERAVVATAANPWETVARNLGGVLLATALSLEKYSDPETPSRVARDLRQAFQRQCKAQGVPSDL